MIMKKTKYNLIFVTALFIFSCKKTDTIPNRTTGVPANSAFIKAIHLSPDAPLFNLMVDSVRALTVLETATDVESGIGFGAIVPSLADGYSIVPGGTHTISAKVPLTSATLPGQTITTKSAALAEGKYYTIAVVDSLSRLTAVIVEDDLSIADTSKAYFRVANFMLNGLADVEFVPITAGAPALTRNGIIFKNVTSFETVPEATYKVILRANGSATRLDSIAAFAPLKARKYTLYTRGVVGQTGSTNTRRPLIFQMTNL